MPLRGGWTQIMVNGQWLLQAPHDGNVTYPKEQATALTINHLLGGLCERGRQQR